MRAEHAYSGAAKARRAEVRPKDKLKSGQEKTGEKRGGHCRNDS